MTFHRDNSKVMTLRIRDAIHCDQRWALHSSLHGRHSNLWLMQSYWLWQIVVSRLDWWRCQLDVPVDFSCTWTEVCHSQPSVSVWESVMTSWRVWPTLREHERMSLCITVLWQLHSVQRSVSSDIYQSLTASLHATWLDYCNATLLGISSELSSHASSWSSTRHQIAVDTTAAIFTDVRAAKRINS